MHQYRVLSSEGKEYGPIDLAGMLQWIREGRVLRTTLIRRDDEPPAPAESLAELSGGFLSLASPAPLPPIANLVALPAEFSAWGFIGMAWDLVKPHWVPLGVMFLIVGAIGAVPYIGGCIALLIGGALSVGIYRAILGMLAGRPPTVGMMFDGFDRFTPAFVASLIMTILVFAGLLLLIVPGIILALMWIFVYPILAETNLDFWPAMTASAALTRGYRWQLFGLALACIPILLLGLLCLCIGVVVAEAVVCTAIALAYRFLQAKQPQAMAVA
jgi:uncharacterized membrane protein